MKVIILAGGLGTRILEETFDKPKPMVLINNRPTLWHIMNIFARQGFSQFILATGYKSEVIEQWMSSLDEPWEITLCKTGLNTQTGGRILACMNLFPGQSVMATYGDGLANISIKELLKFHDSHKKIATVTAVRPPARFGYLKIQNSHVTNFGEKNQADSGWINGGFFVLNPEVKNYIESTDEPFESGALTRLTEITQLMAYQHYGFWQPMDTLREKIQLEQYAKLSTPPWLEQTI